MLSNNILGIAFRIRQPLFRRILNRELLLVRGISCTVYVYLEPLLINGDGRTLHKPHDLAGHIVGKLEHQFQGD